MLPCAVPRRFDFPQSAIRNPQLMDSVLTLRDLESWSRPGVSLAVLGQPIRHSISPVMHNAALAELTRQDAQFSEWKYFRFEIAPEDLRHALGLLHRAKFRGVNLTVPHKVLAFDLVASVVGTAQAVGAVNTLLWTEGGWIGHNTDGYGLAAGLHESLGQDFAGAHVLLLGAGGAARSAAVECLRRQCATLAIANRTRGNLAALLEALAPLAGRIPVRGIGLADGAADLSANAIVLNATSAGLRESDPAPIDLQRIPRPASVYEMIYNPPLTSLLRQARAMGVPSANGLSMLVHQGAKALEIWSGIPAARTSPFMQAAAAGALAG
ncbi:MAG: shikimate 5-dehydrogenase [Verrucomicrobia bacterium]|nr:shikimate 5-dehydrogenase [Verrucomicrobiota bacterium]